MRILIGSLVLIAGIASSAAAAEVTITQKDKSFSEKQVEINVGDTINFVNDDDTTHNVNSTSDGQAFDLGAQAPGTTSSHTFTEAGSFKIRCAIHPKMKVKVTVK